MNPHIPCTHTYTFTPHDFIFITSVWHCLGKDGMVCLKGIMKIYKVYMVDFFVFETVLGLIYQKKNALTYYEGQR